jgi:hypothetical protein
MTSIYSEHGQRPIGSAAPNGPPARIVKTDGFERLFSHYTDLQGDELLAYLQDFQTRALEVHSQTHIDIDLSLWLYPQRRICGASGTRA